MNLYNQKSIFHKLLKTILFPSHCINYRAEHTKNRAVVGKAHLLIYSRLLPPHFHC